MSRAVLLSLTCVQPLAWVGLLCACTQTSSPTGAVSSTAHAAKPAAKAAPNTSMAQRREEEDWVSALRVQEWQRAAALFDKRHPEPSSPELRFVRARMASELGDMPRVAKLLEHLEQQLPILKSEIERMRARAWADVGPYEAAAEWFEKKGGTRNIIRAAAALEKADKPEQAASLLLKELKTEQATKGVKFSALGRLRRAYADLMLRQKQPQKALEHLKWLALEHPTLTASKGADELLEAQGNLKLNKAQRYARAEAFTDAGRFSDASRELKLLSSASGQGPTGVEVLRTRAWSYYKSRRDYQKAAELFAQCAKLEKKHRVQDLFFSARALSRADKNMEAVKGYQALARQFPASSYAEQASYLASRLYFISGRYREAALAYAAYLKRYQRKGHRGRYTDDATYERAVTELALNNGKEAAAGLSIALASTKSDRQKALLKQLKALALQQQGNKAEALELYKAVIEERPLSFAALMAGARIEQLGETPPALVPEGTLPQQTGARGAGAGEDEPAEAPLAIQLPKKVELLLRLGLDLDAETALKRRDGRFRRRYAPRGGEALCQAYGLMSTAAAQYAHAQQVVRERALQRAITPETRWLWECIYPRPYASAVEHAAQVFGIPQGLTHALMRQESAFKPTVVSHAGAVGLMQLMPNTAKHVAGELGQDYSGQLLTSPPKNIEFGSYYLGKMLKTFSGNAALAAASYNAGPSAVKRWLAGSSTLPLDVFVAHIPYHETRNYVSRVMGNWARYAYLAGGEAAVPQLSLELPKPVKHEASDY